MNRREILSWLREQNERRLDELWRLADSARRENVGDEVHLRGLIEISNYCVRQCAYCGIRSGNRNIHRYRMTAAEIMGCVRRARDFGYGTVVMQSGEDYGVKTGWLANIVRRIKSDTPLAVTLSLGERPDEDLMAWREAGGDRYLLRFETSRRELYDQIHPPLAGRRSDRIAAVGRLRELGYETGSGVMVGIPGQTYEDLADDIETFRALDLDMIGVGPYIAHPQTPLGAGQSGSRPADADQAPNTELMTYKVLALARLACPKANIPSTSALAALNKAEGRELGLARGANVVMPNLTPPDYRVLYEIYPAKACIDETAAEFHDRLHRRILAMGRRIGVGRGDCPRRASWCAENISLQQVIRPCQ
jgi:biotin synthase